VCFLSRTSVYHSLIVSFVRLSVCRLNLLVFLSHITSPASYHAVSHNMAHPIKSSETFPLSTLYASCCFYVDEYLPSLSFHVLFIPPIPFLYYPHLTALLKLVLSLCLRCRFHVPFPLRPVGQILICCCSLHSLVSGFSFMCLLVVHYVLFVLCNVQQFVFRLLKTRSVHSVEYVFLR